MKLIFTGPVCAVQNPTGFARHRSALLKIAMRIGFFYIGLIITSVQLIANPGNGQGLDDIKVTLEMNNETLETLFLKIQRETDLSFAFRPDLIDPYQSITLSKATRTVKQVLDQALSSTSLTYKQMDKTVLVYAQAKEATDVEEQALNEVPPVVNDVPVMVLYTVTGKVTDVSGAPMPGVNIIVKGTANGTTSDTSGQFAIDVSDNDVLVFTFIGFRTYEVPVNGKTVVDVTMEEDVKSLQEVEINAGYWQVKDKERTGNISRVSEKEIDKQPVTNVLQALQGRMPGVEIVQNTGVPGGGMTIRIRGQNSLRPEGNYPLYVIDGVPVNSSPLRPNGFLTVSSGIDPLNTLNPINIESVEILKDADATAIYGSRGANGVVLITTKKGKSVKTNLDVAFYQSAGKVSNKMDLLNREQYLEMRKEAFLNSGIEMTTNNARDLLVWDTTRYTDWQKELFGRTANVSDAQIVVSGGNGSTGFRFGGGFHNETTVFPGDFGYKKVTSHFNFNHSSSNQKFAVIFSTNYGFDNHNLFSSPIVDKALTLPPNAPALYNNEGVLNWEVGPTGFSNWVNPLADLEVEQDVKTYNLITNATVSYELLKGLTLRTNLGYSNLTNDEIIIKPKSSYDPTIDKTMKINSTSIRSDDRRSWIIEPQIIYNKNIGNGLIDILVGSTWQKSNNSSGGIEGFGYASDGLLGNIGGAAMTSSLGNNTVQYRYQAFFGRVGYNYKSKYLVNITGRRDGSSRFGPNKQFANFGAVGIGWVFSEEALFGKSLSFLSFGKLRGSFGTSGSDNIGDYGYLETYSPTDYAYKNVKGLYPTQLANPDYSWEINKKLEAAIEFGFFQDRILVSASWYRNRSSNQLVGYGLPAITGFTSVQYNLPATVQNTGWEFQLNTINIQSGSFNWISSVNFTIPKNELVEFPNIKESSYSTQYIVGEPLNIGILYKWLGVDSQTGQHKFLDVNDDGVISAINDRPVVNNLGRRAYGGLHNVIKYRGFEVDFMIEFVKQNGRSHRVSPFTTPGSTSNQPVEVMDRWKAEGDIANEQSFVLFSPVYSIFTRSDRSIQDANFMRLKTLSLSYNVSNRVLEKIKIKECRVYVQTQNLFTWTNYRGLNPEVPGSTALPPLKMFTAGIQFKL